MKKIAFLIPTMSSGGMERVMSELVIYFSAKPDIQCHLIIYGKPLDDFYAIPSNVVVHRPGFKFNDAMRLLSTVKTIFFVRKTIVNIKPDSILSFGEIWNNLIIISLFGLKFPLYVSDRNSPMESLGKVHDFLRKVLYPFATGVIVQTSKASELFKRKFKNSNVKVIGNPIRVIESGEEIKKENSIITVGRLISSKNINRIIDIFAKVQSSDWKLVIVGGDSNKQNNRTKFQAQINSLGMEKNIFLAGVQDQVDDFLLRSKIFVFTSSSEGFPNVIGEAMSSGLPVISYDCVAGPSEMIADGVNGYLIPLYDDLLFEQKLRYLMGNESHRIQMGDAAKASIKKFSVENIASQYYDFIVSN